MFQNKKVKEKRFSVKNLIFGKHTVKSAVAFVGYGYIVHLDLRFSLVFTFDAGTVQVVELEPYQAASLFGRVNFEFLGLYAGRPAVSVGRHKYIYDIDKKDTYDYQYLEWAWGTDNLVEWNMNYYREQGFNVNLNCGHVTSIGLMVSGVNALEDLGHIDFVLPLKLMKYIDVALGIEYDEKRTKVVDMLHWHQFEENDKAFYEYCEKMNTPEKLKKDFRLKKLMVDKKYYDKSYIAD